MSITQDRKKRFEAIQNASSYTEYTHKRFCCGGDYCTGDHLGFIFDFIEQECSSEYQRCKNEIKAILNRCKTERGLARALANFLSNTQ